MAFDLAYFEIRKSTNLVSNDCLGDEASSAIVDSQAPSFNGGPNITGVTLLNGFGHTDLNGTLRYYNATDELTYQEDGDAEGAVVDVSSDGKYALFSDNGSAYITVDVVNASLPGANQTDDIVLARTANDVWDDISSLESWQGDTEYRCLYVANTHPTDSIIEVRLWVGTQPSGADSIEIALDSTGVGNGGAASALAIATEGTAPSPALSFSAPSSEPGALSMGTIAAGEFYPFWVKRIVPSQTLTPTPVDLSKLAFRVVF